MIVVSWAQDEALRHVLGEAADVPAVMRVLDLCDSLRGPTPPASWREQMATLLDDNAAGVAALRTVALRETPFDGPGADHRVLFARAVMWAIGLTEPGDAVALLVRVANSYGEPGRGRDYRSVALTAVEALGSIGGERALPALRQLKAQARLGAVRRAASQELDRTLGEENLSRADVPEWQAEDFELDRDGRRVVDLGHGCTLTIEMAVNGTVTWFFRSPTGQRLPSKPPNVSADRAREALDIAGNLQTVVYAERFRLKQLMKDQRTLTYEDWMEFYLGNRVTGRLCRGLVWESSIDGGEHWQRFLPTWSTSREAWLRLGEDGVSHDIAEESQARLVLPKHITAAETRAWGTRLRALRLRQPFKQLDLR
ncbi:DUF4132 domain-containing protein [Catenulispora sp. GAS73]|uniref:DUF4132 domain-containing protein n=1 Tax=Catenulispora sp. GAS73 TaxID=3156269 RepID=UPI003518B81B